MSLRKIILIVGLIFQATVFSQKIYFVHDSSGTLSFQKVLSKNTKWKESYNQTLNFGFIKEDVIWLKIEKSKRNELLTIPNASIDSITIYSKTKKIICGDRVYNPNYEHPITLIPCGDSAMILRIKKEHSSLVIPLEFKNANSFLKINSQYKMLDILLFGVFVSFLIFAFSLFIYSRSAVFLFFSFYIITTILFYYTSNGLLKSVFFPQFLYFSEIRLYVSCIAPLTLFWFNRSLIQYRTRFLDSISKILTFSILILVGISVLLFNYLKDSYAKEYISFIYILCFVLICVLLFLNVNELFLPKQKSKKRYAYLFLGSILITIILFVLESFRFEWLPDFDLLLLITCFEVIIFGLFISIDFINKFKENENLALKLVQTKKRALNELKVIQFKERQKISTILHNRYQSQLTGFRLYFGNKISSDEPILKEMKRFEEEIRDFSHQILPKELENGLLHDAIYRQIKFLSQVFTDWEISYQAFDFKDEIKEDWIYDIYLILSELIQNSIKHSNGNKIDIEFFNHESEYLLTYSENGNSLDKRAFEQGFGISLIKDQIENIDSEIRFELKPNLFIIIRIPK